MRGLMLVGLLALAGCAGQSLRVLAQSPTSITLHQVDMLTGGATRQDVLDAATAHCTRSGLAPRLAMQERVRAVDTVFTYECERAPG